MNTTTRTLRAGMAGVGMIFDDTYWPLFAQTHATGLYHRRFGPVEVQLAALASRTGSRAARWIEEARRLGMAAPLNCTGPDAVRQMLSGPLDAVCIATPDDRHFDAARAALSKGTHVLIEKPSVLSMQELDELERLAREKKVLARVVYHKLADPDHKKLRTHVADGVLKHVNNGYCSLLEPKQISGQQFAEWITGRNPGTYVAVHYVKLIDFTFSPPNPSPRVQAEGSKTAPHPQPLSPSTGRGEQNQDPLTPNPSPRVQGEGSKMAWRLARITANGQRGLVGPADGPTWDSVQLQMVYAYDDGREAAFDVHTSWVTPDNFPGYVDQEVQFRFDNGVWIAHQRKRGVELTVEGRTPGELKSTPNHHYNGKFLEPWDERSQRGYGVEVIGRFFEEVAFVEWGGPAEQREQRLGQMRALGYADLSADRNTVAVVQAMEALLARQAAGVPGCVVKVNDERGGLALYAPGREGAEVLYAGRV